MTANDFVSWYEASLPAGERKLRGHFSTPPWLVEQILIACGYTADKDLSRIRVLDPACGSGNFLLGAARHLIAFSQNSQIATSPIQLIQHNIWGFDPDPIACFLAEIQLRQLLNSVQNQPSPPLSNITHRHNFHHQEHLHIHQADGLTIPWGLQPTVDLFLANPPYLASKNTDLSIYYSEQTHGQSDSYLLFLKLALQIVRPNGWLGLVLPDPVLARTNATRERQRLLSETTIHHLWHLAGVFPAYVGAAVIIAQKRPPRRLHQVAWKRERWHRSSSINTDKSPLFTEEIARINPQPTGTYTIAQALLSRQPNAEMRYLLSNSQQTLVERLHAHLCQPSIPHQLRHLTTLDNYVLIRRGEEIGKGSSLLSPKPLSNGEICYPVLRGGTDIRPYAVPHAQSWIAATDVKKNLERYLAPKLLVVKSMGSLQATLDLQGHVVLQTLYLLQIHTNKPDEPKTSEQTQLATNELYFLLALLNSRLLREYVYVLHTAYKWVQPQIEQSVLLNLPIPILSDFDLKEQIIQLAKALMNTCSKPLPGVKLHEQSAELYEEQERAICALYELTLSGRHSQKSLQNIADKGVTFYG